MEDIEFNDIQTPIKDLELDKVPTEVKDQFYDFINHVPYIKSLISKDRLRAKDLPRDEEGKIIVDITRPHILENMDYFRETGLHYKEHGCYTFLRPNANINSEFGKWFSRELNRCLNGMIRKSDGEWITGDMYFYLNYAPIIQTVPVKKGSTMSVRIENLPDMWEGVYLRTHYMDQARKAGRHGAEISSRGKSKSYTLAAMAAKRFTLGESIDAIKKIKCFLAAYQKEFLNKDGTLNKFESIIDFIADNTQFPIRRLKSSMNDMQWKMGYEDLNTGTKKGSLNEVIGVSVKDDESKLRGKRGSLIVLEEIGSWPGLISLYNTLRPGMEEGIYTFGLIYMIGTSAQADSDFSSAQELVYNPKGYNLYAVNNRYDKEGLGKPFFTFFFPGYMNYKGHYDENGNSDVTASILAILKERYLVKYNASDVNTITRTMAEIPITPSEALLRADNNIFPVAQLTERESQLMANPHELDSINVVELVQNKSGDVLPMPTDDKSIRIFPTKNNQSKGAIELYEMPEKDANGKVFNNRYIAGIDPYAKDQSTTMSLGSIFILDLWTDSIVAEYTGRPMFADDFHEICRLLLLFYNAKGNYENNINGLFGYFKKMHCLHLLTDKLSYLSGKEELKSNIITNATKGTTAGKFINSEADRLTRDWLLQPKVITKGDEESGIEEVTTKKLYELKSLAFIQELIKYSPNINVDRIRAFGMLMLLREERLINCQGNINKTKIDISDYPGNDEFFKNNYFEEYDDAKVFEEYQ